MIVQHGGAVPHNVPKKNQPGQPKGTFELTRISHNYEP